MRVLFDLLHPAHVHFFKHVIWHLEARGADVTITSRDKDLTVELLDRYGFDHEVLSGIGRRKLDLAREFLARTVRLNQIVRRERPDVMAGVMGVSIAPVGRINRIPTVVVYGTENARLSNRWVYASADEFLTSEAFRFDYGPKHTRFPGTHELSYLAPKYFTPDPGALARTGLGTDEVFSIIRFVSWGASHDIGHRGISDDDKETVVRLLSEHSRVLISSEGVLPEGLRQFRLEADPTDIHSLLSYATVVFGESATMAAEAGALGTPAVFVDNEGRGFTDYLGEFGLVLTVPETSSGIASGIEWVLRSFEDDERDHRIMEARSRLLGGIPDLPKFISDKLISYTAQCYEVDAR